MKKYKCQICSAFYDTKEKRDYCKNSDSQMIDAYYHTRPECKTKKLAKEYFLMELL